MNEELDEIDGTLDSPVDFVYAGKVPGSLTALCVLTFIGSALILIKSFCMISLFVLATDATNTVAQSDIVQNPFRGMGLHYLVEIITCLISITGAILLLKLKKSGFLLYVFSAVIYCINVIWFFAISFKMGLSGWSVLIILLYVTAPIAFLIMYSTFKRYLH
jgi:hypothetical protein